MVEHHEVASEYRGLRLDGFQREAMAAVADGRNVVVAAPTGSGKTLIAEYAIDRALKDDLRSVYTTPIKALSNQKYRDLCALHGSDRVGLLTGDNSIRPDAPVIVMTTEVLRNMIYTDARRVDDLAVVVMDEVHYLQDRLRGPVWEEVIIHAPERPRFVCLSATISNANELGDWIRTLRGPTDVVIETKRPTRLEPLFVASGGRKKGLVTVPLNRARHPESSSWRAPRRDRVITMLDDRQMLPAIWFIFGRRACDEAAERAAAELELTSSRAERAEVEAIAMRHLGGLSEEDREAVGVSGWLRVLRHGVAAHHAGLLPAFKEAIEECFSAGLIKVVFATETLALGVNMPARTVIIDALAKYSGARDGGHTPLTPGEFVQMTGRAGRRGLDERGYAVVPQSKFNHFAAAAKLAESDRFTLTSAFRPTYNMAIHLLDRYEYDDAVSVLRRSFAQFQMDRSLVERTQRQRSLEATAERQLAAAQCSRGSIAAAMSGGGAGPQRRGDRAAVAKRLAALRPGAVVLGVGRGPQVVLSTGVRRGDQVTVRVMNADGHVMKVSPREVTGELVVAGMCELPRPYRPTERTWRRKVGRVFDIGLAEHPEWSTTKVHGRARGDRRDAESRPEQSEAERVRACPRYADHAAQWNHYQRTRSKLRRLERATVRQESALEQQFARVLGVLEARGYVDDHRVTERGERLGQLFCENDLLMSAAIETGLTDGLDQAELAAFVSCFTFSARGRDNLDDLPVPPGLNQRLVRLAKLADQLQRTEHQFGVEWSRPPDPGLCDVVHRWAHGASLADVVDDGLSAGDLVRQLRLIIDLLRQIAESTDRPRLAATAEAAWRAMERGIVASSNVVPLGDGLT